jgi:hypothetical protein
MNKVCKQCNCSFEITDEDLKFYDKVSPVFNDVKYSIPEPSLCPDCRQLLRIQLRNFRHLYHVKSDFSEKNIISMYPPESPFIVYSSDEWWSDKWDAMEYGKDFDFNKPFFEQFDELNKVVPKLSLMRYQAENCDYCNFAFKSYNCYLVFGCVENEDCLFGHIVWQSKDCLDGLYLYRCKWCYESIDCVSCYQAMFSQECFDCSEIYFSYDCIGCNNCFGCTGLRKKEYCWFNEYIGKEKYLENIKELFPLTNKKIDEIKIKVLELRKTIVYPDCYKTNSEDVSGNHIYFSKNTNHSFDAKECEDSKFIFTGQYFKDVYDASFSVGYCELCYNCLTLANGQNLICCHWIPESSNCYYCDNCNACKNCFGCSGLRRKEYCIFNKQYTKEEYEILVSKIIEYMQKTAEWGEFFPENTFPFAYNESIVSDYYPLNKEEALFKGYKWRDEDEQSQYQGMKYNVPENINDVQDDISNAILECETTGKAYKIIPQELNFYRKMGLPIPKSCPDQRHLDRIALRNPRKLWDKNCMKCNCDIKTTYSPEMKEIVYCEECYNDYIYS